MKYFILIALIAPPLYAQWNPGTWDLYEGASKTAEHQTLPECQAAGEALTDPAGAIACRTIVGYTPQDPPAGPPTTCTANTTPATFEDDLAAAVSGDVLCLADGEYPYTVLTASGITVMPETPYGATFRGISVGDGNFITGIRSELPTKWGAAACAMRGIGSIIERSVCLDSSAYSLAVTVSIGGHSNAFRENVVGGRGRYTVACLSSDSASPAEANVIERNIARFEGNGSGTIYPNATYKSYGCPNAHWLGNVSVDANLPSYEQQNSGGDFATTSNGDRWPNGNIFDGNVAAHHPYHTDGTTDNSVCFDGSFKQSGGSVLDPPMQVTNHYCRGLRVGFQFHSVFSGDNFVFGPCTAVDVATLGDATCNGDAAIDWTWPQEERAFDEFCDPSRRQSGWCVSGMTLSEYIQ